MMGSPVFLSVIIPVIFPVVPDQSKLTRQVANKKAGIIILIIFFILNSSFQRENGKILIWI